MRELVFNIEFLSDIVLHATSNTEGKIDPLEFIPGSNFLGMVAKNYDDFADSFKVFHSGLVRFMDANLLVNDKLYYKTPYSFYKKKILEENEEEFIYNHHIADIKWQPKQLRKGFIDPDIDNGLKLYEIKYNYAQKSSYDKNRRRSKSGNMYGYKAMPKGLKWQFKVKIDSKISQKDIDLIEETLLKSTRLGKSKSSEYGRVKITKAQDCSPDIEIESSNELTYIYANSRLALVDENGNPSLDPIHLIEGLTKENIDYSKIQIKTNNYRQYNNKMRRHTHERVVINKGSVFALKGLSKEQKEKLKEGAGVYLSEGFGELLINPKFLLEAKIKLIKESKKENIEIDKIKATFKDNTLNYLKAKHNSKIEKLELADNVYKFIEEYRDLYSNISNSQWGTIRSICVADVSEDIKEKPNYKKDEIEKYKLNKIKEYISEGKVKWSQAQQEKLLKHKLNFIQLLAMEMPKAQDRGGKNAN